MRDYPSPNTGRFIFELENVVSECKVFIYNTIRAKVLSKETFLKNIPIDLPNIQKGIYFTRTNNGSKIMTKK